MSFRIRGLSAEPFIPLFGLSDAALAAQGARRVRVDQPHAAPCRVGLDDAEPGETVILVSHPHQPADTPFRQSGPIFVREGLTRTWDRFDEIPPAIARRPISLRAYDEAGMMLEGDLADGAEVGDRLEEWFARPEVAVVHLHYARRGCFAALATRA